MEWEEIKKEMISQKEQAIRDLGNEGKLGREVQTVSAFLKCLGHDFNEKDIKSVSDQFPDVLFGQIQFEVKELMDEGRRRLDEYNSELTKIKNAASMTDLLEKYTPVENNIIEVCNKIQERVREISSRYSEEARKSVDLLIYFNLRDVLVADPATIPEFNFNGHNWRSVSVVGSSWCFIIRADQGSPDFILTNLMDFKRKYGIWE